MHNAIDQFYWDDSGTRLLNISRSYFYSLGKANRACSAQAFVKRVNQQGLCGFNDWRLPTVVELISIVDYGFTHPSIDSQFFPNTQLGNYWTNQAFAENVDYTWTLGFEVGNVHPEIIDNMASDNGFVRLVRGNHARPLVLYNNNDRSLAR